MEMMSVDKWPPAMGGNREKDGQKRGNMYEESSYKHKKWSVSIYKVFKCVFLASVGKWTLIDGNKSVTFLESKWAITI